MAKQKDFRHIVRIANTDIDGRKTLLSGLKAIRGVDFSMANAICIRAGVDRNKTAGNMEEEEIHKLNQILKDPASYNLPDYLLNRRKDYDSGRDIHLIGMDLEFAQKGDVKRLQKIKSYRGMRLAWGLPVRGQRTRSNFRKNKGRVVGVKRKKGVKSGRV